MTVPYYYYYYLGGIFSSCYATLLNIRFIIMNDYYPLHLSFNFLSMTPFSMGCKHAKELWNESVTFKGYSELFCLRKRRAFNQALCWASLPGNILRLLFG